MNALRRVWDHFEEGFIAFLLAAMTLVTFVYVILNNFYTLFYALAVQRIIGLIACLACLGYAGLITVASFDWMGTLLSAGIGAEDLGHYGIMQWHITVIVPFGYAMVFIRFLEIFVRILRNQQTGLGLADEAAEAMKLTEHEEPKQ